MLKIIIIFLIIIAISVLQPFDIILDTISNRENFSASCCSSKKKITKPKKTKSKTSGTKLEKFLVPNTKHPYNWHTGSIYKTHVYSGTQKDDQHTFNSSGQYVKDVGSKDYVSCRNQGLTKEFCLQTPYTNNSPGTCMCSNGQLGRKMPGFKGKCICGSDTFQANYLTNN